MILRIFLLISIALAIYILWTRKSAQDQTLEGASHQPNIRILLIGLGILGGILVFIMAAELITRL